MPRLKNLLKSADAFKVDATFVIPRKSNKKGSKNENEYTESFGSLPGFCFTLIASLLAMIYLIPKWGQMTKGNLDVYIDGNDDDNYTEL